MLSVCYQLLGKLPKVRLKKKYTLSVMGLSLNENKQKFSKEGMVEDEQWLGTLRAYSSDRGGLTLLVLKVLTENSRSNVSRDLS